MDIGQVISIITDMWTTRDSIPSSFPLPCVRQFLSGAVELLPDPEIILSKLMELLSSIDSEVASIKSVRQVIEMIAKAQSRPGFEFSMLNDLDFLNQAPPTDVNFDHFGIPRAVPEYFKQCIQFYSLDQMRVLDYNAVIHLWFGVMSLPKNGDEQQVGSIMNIIWNIINPQHLTTIDIEDFFIGLYLTRVHDEGFILPNRLHQLARERLEKWFKESSWILGQMPMVSTPEVEETQQHSANVIDDSDFSAILERVDRLLLVPAHTTISAVDPSDNNGAREVIPVYETRVSRLQPIGNSTLDKAINEIIDALIGWQRLSGSIAPNGPSENDLNAYAVDKSAPGPTVDNFRIHWEGTPGKGWNYQASFVFADHFLELLRNGYWPDAKFPSALLVREALANRFRSRLPRLREERRKNLIRHFGSLSEQTVLKIARDAGLKEKRRNSRRDEV